MTYTEQRSVRHERPVIKFKFFWIVAVTIVCFLLSIAMSYAAAEPDGPIARRQIQRVARQMLYEEKFADLEKLADGYRKGKAVLPQGLWKLVPFYEGVEKPRISEMAIWQIHLKKIDRWLAAYPESITARVASGFAWMNYAYVIIGPQGFSSAGDERKQKYFECLAKAAKILGDKTLPPGEDCPGRHQALLRLASSQMAVREKFETLFNEATRFEPTYLHYYYQMLGYLSPNWFGAPGEWQAFANQAAQTSPASFGKGLYARILWSAWDGSMFTSFDAPGVSWPLFKEGFAELVKLYPDSPFLINQFCRFACLAGDKGLAKDLFLSIGTHPYLEAWGAKPRNDEVAKKEFLKWRAWASVDKESPVTIDLTEPADYQQIRLLADAGDAVSQFWAGVLDKGVAAQDWKRRAAEGGIADAQTELAASAKAPAEMFQWLIKAADNGNEYALKRVGSALLGGNVLPIDNEKAYVYLSQVKTNDVQPLLKEAEKRLGSKLPEARTLAREFERELVVKRQYYPAPDWAY